MKEYVLPGVLFAVVLIVLGLFAKSTSEYRYREKVQEQVVEQIKLDARATEAAYAARERSRVAEVIHKEKIDAATSKALADNPSWADERVPDSVIDAIGM